jgi:hypothetical protein
MSQGKEKQVFLFPDSSLLLSGWIAIGLIHIY